MDYSPLSIFISVWVWVKILFFWCFRYFFKASFPSPKLMRTSLSSQSSINESKDSLHTFVFIQIFLILRMLPHFLHHLVQSDCLCGVFLQHSRTERVYNLCHCLLLNVFFLLFEHWLLKVKFLRLWNLLQFWQFEFEKFILGLEEGFEVPWEKVDFFFPRDLIQNFFVLVAFHEGLEESAIMKGEYSETSKSGRSMSWMSP